MVRLLGKLPDRWWKAWDARHLYFTEDGTALVDTETGIAFGKPYTVEERLAEGVHFKAGADGRKIDIVVPQDESAILADLLKKMLRYDPKERISVDSVLEHPWFKL